MQKLEQLANGKWVTRACRRLFKVTRFDIPRGQDPMDGDPTMEDTVIAWNQVDAMRRAPGQYAVPPEFIDWVDWSDPPMIVRDQTFETFGEAQPTIAPQGWEDEGGWDF